MNPDTKPKTPDDMNRIQHFAQSVQGTDTKPVDGLGEATKLCAHCGGDIAIRNPKGFCDHLYYPESCAVCEARYPSQIAVLKQRVNEAEELAQALLGAMPPALQAKWPNITRRTKEMIKRREAIAEGGKT